MSRALLFIRAWWMILRYPEAIEYATVRRCAGLPVEQGPTI